HNPHKQAEVDEGVLFDDPTTTLYGSSIPAPEHISIDDSVANDVYQIRITWDTAKIYTGITFNLKLVRHDAGGDVVVVRANTADMEYTVGNLSLGSYSVFIRGMNAAGQLGEEAEVDMTIGPPLAPSSLSLYSTNFSIKIVPVVNGVVTLGTRYQFYRGATQSEALAMANYVGQGYEFLDDGLRPQTTYWYSVRAFNNAGKSALVTGSIATKKDATDIMTVISDAIPDIEWARNLSHEVATNTSAVGLLKDHAYLVVNNEGRVSGVAISTTPGASVVDILADYFAVTDPDTLQRKLYWDGTRNRLVVNGEINAVAGVFDNVTINESCTVLGTFSAAQISGDFVQSRTEQIQVLKNSGRKTFTYVGNPLFAMDVTCICTSAWNANQNRTPGICRWGLNGTEVSNGAIEGWSTTEGNTGGFYMKTNVNAGQSCSFYVDQQGADDNGGWNLILLIMATPTGRSGIIGP
ncbi:phage tail tip protein J-related protein, partial [Acerihabitans sp.]|uniref:phage tail tip protein J-related protein n=1 Tax=Acerihabitans sp. TaxID=2811394 RepID=UPI002ED7C826